MPPSTTIQPQTSASPSPPAAPPQPPPQHVKHAHRFLLLYIAVLLAALLAGGIYAWQNNKVKDFRNKLSQANSQITTLNKQLADAEAAIPSNTNAGNAPNNPYAGWKTFCDNFSNVCLRYPKDWVIAGNSSASKTSETFTNANSAAVVSYDNPYPADKPEQVYFIADIQDLTIKNLGLKIIGRVLGSAPEYTLVDAKYISDNHVTAGQSISFTINATFTTNVQNVTARLKAAPTGQSLANIKTADQASGWFKTDDAKTSLKILQSLYYQ